MCVELIYDSLVFVSFTDCTFAIHLWAKMILINSLLRSLILRCCGIVRCATTYALCARVRRWWCTSSHLHSYTHTRAHSPSAAINISLRLFDVARSTTAQTHLAQCVCLLISRSYFVSPLSTNAALLFRSINLCLAHTKQEWARKWITFLSHPPYADAYIELRIQPDEIHFSFR